MRASEGRWAGCVGWTRLGRRPWLWPSGAEVKGAGTELVVGMGRSAGEGGGERSNVSSCGVGGGKATAGGEVVEVGTVIGPSKEAEGDSFVRAGNLDVAGPVDLARCCSSSSLRNESRFRLSLLTRFTAPG